MLTVIVLVLIPALGAAAAGRQAATAASAQPAGSRCGVALLKLAALVAILLLAGVAGRSPGSWSASPGCARASCSR